VEPEKGHVKRVAWGTGRVVVRANLSEIQELLATGWPLTTVFRRMNGSLGGVSYRQFAEHVRRELRSNAKDTTKEQRTIGDMDSTNEKASLVQQRLANRERSENPGRPAKFQPGPRVPNPKDIY
jgi:hypothetical protein